MYSRTTLFVAITNCQITCCRLSSSHKIGSAGIAGLRHDSVRRMQLRNGCRLTGYIPSARQLVRQGGGVAAPLAGQGRPGWPMAAHQLASAYDISTATQELEVPSMMCRKQLLDLVQGRQMRHPGNHSITGVPTACALAFWVSVAAAQVVPGNPSSSALPESPGATGTVRSGGAPAGSQTVIPVGPGPSYPRVARGITQPPEPFGPQSGLGIEPLSPLPESERPLSGSLGVARLGDLEGPPTGLTIDQAIDRVLRINLELRAQAMEISTARADVLTAGLRGNPLVYMDSALVP